MADESAGLILFLVLGLPILIICFCICCGFLCAWGIRWYCDKQKREENERRRYQRMAQGAPDMMAHQAQLIGGVAQNQIHYPAYPQQVQIQV